ncbi:response regulator transcription factor [Variovorax sp. J31P207]|uniref:response regulator transcription factor n=1 Tax=Variovorax sp. J31P207 TaxID=3053510 RepID=UPI00257849BB|nr:response regulator transcription factor [Variovorax sp. J31P207]MDM0069643.1 response regulator transcription factor [Variovorax sp. J31P207]
MNIYVVDDHPMMREAVAMVLRRLRPGRNIVELERLGKLRPAVSAHGHPDLITLDLNLPDTKGVSGVLEARDLFPSVPLAVYSASPADEMEDQCLQSGADVYIDKAAGVTTLSNALKRLFQGNVDPDVQALPTANSVAGLSLSKRQTQLLACLERGMNNREIAEQLDISEHTVKVHLWRLFRKIDVNSRTQALFFARTHGLIPS